MASADDVIYRTARVSDADEVFDLLTLFANELVTELRTLPVLEGNRGHGIGRTLVKEEISRATARGSVEVTVPTRRAGGFYDLLGFERTADYFKFPLNS